MSGLMQNLRFGWRLLRRSPGFTIVAVLTLALGIGATTAIFSVVYASLLAPLPYPKPDQLVMVWSKVQGFRNVISIGDFLDWKRDNKSFQSLNAWTGSSFNLATGDQPQMINGQLTTPGFYSMMGVNFMLGRDFLPEEGQVGKDHEVVLSNRLWQKLGGDRGIVGRQLRLNGEPYTVVGVMAPGATDRLQSQLVVPLAFKPDQINHDFHSILAMGRLKPEVSVAAAQADMDVITARIAKDFPQDKGWGASVEPLKNDFFPREEQQTLWVLLGAVGFVLLIACANVANLLLAKATTRLKEVALRSSLGATRWRIFTQFVTESLVLASAGGILGIAFGFVILKGIMAAMPPFTLPSEADVRLSVPVLLFTLAATMLSGIIFGCAPAWRASEVNLNETLKEGGRSGTGRERQRLRRILVVAEFGLALTLLAGAGLAIRTFWNLTKVDMGVRPDHVATFFLPVRPDRFAKPEQLVLFYRQLLEKFREIPGVSQAAVVTGLPTQGVGFGMAINIVGQPQKEAGSRDNAGFQMVTPDYFKTFGIQVIKGRTFTDRDVDGTPRVAMVSESFVRHFLPGLEPIGQRVLINQLVPGARQLGPVVDWEVVGVFHDVHRNDLRNQNLEEIDVPFYQSPWPSTNVGIHSTGDPLQLRNSIAAAVSSMDPDVPVAEFRTMNDVIDESFVGDRFVTMLYGIFAVLALILAAVGIYGVMAFSVAQRTHEIGLRMALGADRGEVIGLVLKEGIALALIGSAVGLIGACFVGRAMQGFLFGVGRVDFVAFLAVSTTLLAAAVLACYLPARRAARVDPMVALRYE